MAKQREPIKLNLKVSDDDSQPDVISCLSGVAIG
jgi:hypothetical protein